MKIMLQKKSDNTIYDITKMSVDVESSRDYQSPSRLLKFKIINPTVDENMMLGIKPVVNDKITAYDSDGNKIFYGDIWGKTNDSSSEYSYITCYDPIYILTLTEIVKVYYDVTPEDIASQLAAEYNIKIGNIAKTGQKINHVALGKTPYEIIMGAYTKASKSTGQEYQLRMSRDKEKLEVITLGNELTNILLSPESNLKNSKYETDLTQMVNRVSVYDNTNGKEVTYAENSQWEDLYGVIQKAVAYEKDKDNVSIAQNELKDMDRKCEVDAIGYSDAITGNCIYVEDKVTDVVGKFYIQADSHTYSENVHSMKLTLNFECLMDKKDIPDSFESSEKESSKSSKSDGTKAGDIIATAKQYIGVPYVWGGTTPEGFDCSGFVQYVFGKNGISLPRVSEDQANSGIPVSRADLQPGDLVFPRANNGHVQIYIGNGQVIHSPHTGASVCIVDMGSFSSARRVI